MTWPANAAFPVLRPRRLRQSPALRALVAETRLSASQLVLPLFVRPGRRLRREVGAMPGVFQLSPDEILREATRGHSACVPAVLLFGIPDRKDAKASGAWAKNGIVQQTVRLLKKELPSLLVITDVCLCEYMDHGHCGIVHRKGNHARVLNDPSLKLLAQSAASHAEAGADMVMVKPALAYLDLIHRVKTTFAYPTAAYSVSAEYSMIKAAAARGWIDERAVTLESLLSMRRAGADILITSSAIEVAGWLDGK